MKILSLAKSVFGILLTALVTGRLQAQPSPTNAEPAVVGVGPDERIWSTDDPRSSRRIIEMATGMNYWDGQKWVPSEPAFEPTTNGFVAERVQHRVRLAADLNQIGAVTVIVPDRVTHNGMILHSTPVGIGLFDAASGQSAIIGSITNCSGVLVGDRRVVYENAFSGVCASVVYTIDRDLFSQDVVITGRLDPADYGFPTNTTRIQIFTEFYEPSEPERITRPLYIEQDPAVRRRMWSPDVVDEMLGFGEFVLATGRAATLATISDLNAPTVPVAKEFTTISGRTFLIESVPHRWIQRELQTLPDCAPQTASVEKRRNLKKSRLAVLKIPAAGVGGEQARANRSPAPNRRMAQALMSKRPGVVIDYLATIGGTLSGTRVFQGDATYFLTNAVTCNGAVTIEGGACFKFPTNSNVYLKLNNSVTCKSSSYRPAIFTAGDDSTVGDAIGTNIWSGYTGTIRTNGYGNPALWVYYLSAPTLSNLRFRYAQEAIRFEGGSLYSGTLSHSQLVNCIRGIVINGNAGCGGVSGLTVTVNNSLIANVQRPLNVNFYGSIGNFYHATVDSGSYLITSSVESASGNFYNSILANITNLKSSSYPVLTGNHNGFYNSPTFGTSQYTTNNTPFQSVGAGNYYLAAGSNFRNVGITNGLSSSLLAELKRRTTYPPLVLTNTVTFATTLSPQAQRDTDTLDLGFHYESVDWAVNTLTVSNITLTLTNGVVLARFGSTGIWLSDGGQLFSEGNSINHNHLTQFFNVQEQPINWGGATLGGLTINPYNYGVAPASARIRFTDFDGMANGGYHLYLANTNWTLSSLLLQDCSFNSAIFVLDGPDSSVLGITNNLFERITGSFLDAPQITLYNNLFRFGTNTTWNTGTNNWTFSDNVFDNSGIDDIGNAVTAAYNAYINMGTNRFYPTNANDQVLTSFTYKTGPLGSYYHSSTNLLDMGSLTNAALRGLYHYTTTTNQVKEANSILDIGFHYVATDASGNPLDYDGDGISDYLEDYNGNGTVDSGETDWQSSGDLGLRVLITRPRNGSTIP